MLILLFLSSITLGNAQFRIEYQEIIKELKIRKIEHQTFVTIYEGNDIKFFTEQAYLTYIARYDTIVLRAEASVCKKRESNLFFKENKVNQISITEKYPP